jgi:hypothetical protein
MGARPTCQAPGVPISVREEDRPPHEEHATSCGSAPLRLRQKQQPSLTRGPGPTSHPPRVPVPWCREVKPPIAPIPRLLGAAAEDGEVKFSKLMWQYRGTPRMA